MSKNKFILLFIVGILFIWVTTYFLWLNVEPQANDKLTTKELEELDNRDEIFYDAIISFNDNSYKLSDLSKSVLEDTVVVSVEVNNRKVQGYVTYNDIITEPQVKLSDDDDFAQIILPDEGDDDNEK